MCFGGVKAWMSTYVVPHGVVETSTSVSLNNPRLQFYKNNWKLLSEAFDINLANLLCFQRPAKKPAPPKQVPISLEATILEAEKRGMSVEPVSTREHGVNWLHISKKRCQVMMTTPVEEVGRTYIPLNLPKSEWAEFLVYYVKRNAAQEPQFYILPRMKLNKRTVLSPTSSWLREYEDAWYLLA
jgi:hypothetical protein